MKIIFYCQHVLGVGHLFRTLEICRHLRSHEVLLVSGGKRPEVALPENVTVVELPALMMDENFSGFYTAEPAETVAQVKERRRRQLRRLVERELPDLFVVELYPFGRKAFRFELDPILEAIRTRRISDCKAVCSLRDILVEKSDAAKYEQRVVDTLNRYFDALLIHSDPQVLRLEETFTRLGDVSVPCVYTGFVTPKPAPDAGKRLRRRLGLSPRDRLVVASIGGGKVGGELLEATVAAFERMGHQPPTVLHLFAGPFMDSDRFDRLTAYAGPRLKVARFTPEFLAYLSAADLSLSMAGYNTCLNLMAAGVRALVWPFGQNREQRLRAERLNLRILSEAELRPARLAGIMTRALERPTPPPPAIDLDGGRYSAEWLASRGR